MVVIVEEKFEKTRHVKNKDKRNARFYDRILFNR